MIDKTKIIPTVITKVTQLPLNHYIDLRTYKRNRSVIIIKKEEDLFHIIENGYNQEEMEVNLDKLPKTLKGLLKKEFPRSNKVRVYNMGEYDPTATEQINRKII